MTTAKLSVALLSLYGVSSLVVEGCASSGTEPHAMTAGQHETAAKTEEQAAKEHAAQYAPSPPAAPLSPTVRCPFSTGAACYRSWTSILNPTEVHLTEGKRHTELANQHRTASQALRDAESRACRNVPEGDRDISPFYHREDIVSVSSIKGNAPYGGAPVNGAEVVFASLPGMTAEWLQRVVDCHLARNAALGDGDKMPYCPLAVPHVQAQVRSVGNGFAVDITSEDERSVKDVLARVQGLTSKTAHRP